MTARRVLGPMRVVALAALLVVAALAPTLDAAALDRPRVHAPIRIVGDAAFLLPGSGVVAGNGTPEAPFVIAGWTFVLPLLPSSSRTQAPLPLEQAAAIRLEGTRAHVVIRDNRFVAPLPHATDAPTETAPGVALAFAENVTIERNALLGVGGVAGAVSVRNESAARVADNSFLHGQRPAVHAWRSLVAVERNVVDMESRACCVGPYGLVTLELPHQGSVVRGNDLSTRAVGMLGGGAVGVDVPLGVEGGGEVLIEGNRIAGLALGGVTVWAYAGATVDVPLVGAVLTEDGSFVMRNNTVDGDWSCVVARAPFGVMEGNAFTGCGKRELDHVIDETIRVLGNNTIEGLPMVELRGVRDATVDLAGVTLAWFRALDVEHSLVRNVTMARDGFPTTARLLHNVTFEDFTASERRASFSGVDVTLRRALAAHPYSPPEGPRPAFDLAGRGAWRLENVSASGADPAVSFRFVDDGALAVHHSAFRASQGAGLVVDGVGRAAIVTIDNSTFSGSGVGLEAHGSAAARLSLNVTNSSFVGDLGPGFVNDNPTIADARGNWWGHASGPSGPLNPSGLGEAVVGPALVDPWLAAPRPDAPAP